MNVTDELLAKLEWSAKNTCSYGEDDWFKPDDLRHDIGSDDAKYVSASSPFAMLSLITELRRLRAENAELAQSLAESSANDQAAMGWLTSLRWASGDRGERMLPELVTHIEGLAKDAGWYRWLRDDALNIDGWAPAAVITEGSMIQQCLEGRDLDDEIDTAMATQ